MDRKRSMLPLFCKSYRRDVLRLKRLIDSVETYNVDNLPIFVSVPSEDLQIFKDKIGHDRCNLLDDNDILSTNPNLKGAVLSQSSGGILQQVVKAEFWRFYSCDAYVCLDSDAFFIRNFSVSDFIDKDGIPFTVIHQCKEYLQHAANAKRYYILQDFSEDSTQGQALFNRSGANYDFGPIPVIWASKVWRDLDELFLRPLGLNIIRAITRFPSEFRWYGECLLAYDSIPVRPIEPLFRVYHHEWQYNALEKEGENLDSLRNLYLGVVLQSNWDHLLDFGPERKKWTSRVYRNIRNRIRRIGY